MQKIYKIYSRRRLNLGFINHGSFKGGKQHNIRIKKVSSVLIVFIIAFTVCNTVWRAITPVFEALAKDDAKSIATLVTNEETTKIMNKYNYDTFFTTEKDDNGNVKMISANVLKINQVTSDIAVSIQNSLKKNKETKIEIPMGSLTGSRIFSGVGPKISAKLAFVGNVETDVRSEFLSQGVNQTIHRVYLDVSSTVEILTPFSIIKETIDNQVLILENVIVGQIPSSYYNINGITSNQALDIVE